MSRLADVAIKAVTAPHGYPTEGGLCQRFVRLVVTEALGDKWGEIVRTPSAKQSAIKLLNDGYAKPYTGQAIQPGDILYKTKGSGGFGHVGIAVRHNGELMVAENSSYHLNHGDDARGFRTLEQFGPFQVLARLPEPQQATQPEAATTPAEAPHKPSIIVSHYNGTEWVNTRIQTVKDGATNWVPVQQFLKAAGVEYSVTAWGDGTPNVRVTK